MVEQDVAPAGVASLATHSGGAGAPPGGIKTPCEELADARVRWTLAGKRGPAPKNAAMERREAPHTLVGVRTC
jgi:hypothetical protein